MDKVRIMLPDSQDPTTSQYTLFPSRNRKGGGRAKKSPEKLNIDFGSVRKNECQYKIMSKQTSVHKTPPVSLVEEHSWPSIVKIDNPNSVRASPRKPSSFADMVRRKIPAETDKKTIALKDPKKAGVSGKSEKVGTKTKPVLNKISAFTYSQIGRSDDESKYVSSSRPVEDSRTKTIPSALRRDVLVEFKESSGSSEDDFEVEFSSSAVVKKADRNTVNKISAGTFQQIGKTSAEQAKYVMQPVKSWSSIVGKNSRDPRPEEDEGEVPEQKSREPSVHDKIKAKMKEGIELTVEEREILRQKRRERRWREKELKKKEKENKQIQEIYKPQTTKLNMISGELLSKCKDVSTAKKASSIKTGNKIKFLDEEYPDLGKIKKVNTVLTTEIRDEEGRLQSSERESNSEWETEDECKEIVEDLDKLEAKEEAMVEIVTDNVENLSYSSILKSTKKPALKIVKTSDEKAEKRPTENKKVKKQDPIFFDITSALQVTRQRSKKVSGVVTSKVKNSSKSVRNQLDSTAPMKKRGKEREGGKKKKKTLMKKIIIADRERRREERLKSGQTLKALPQPPDDDILQGEKTGATEELKEESKDLPNTNVSLENRKEKNVDDDEEVSESSNLKSNIEIEDKKETETVESSNQNDRIEFKAKNERFTVNKDKAETEAEVIEKFIASSLEEKALSNIHSRKFRTYCDHLLSVELDNSVAALMSDLIRFQDKVYNKDPDKARAKRRYVVGLRECSKFLKVKKLSCVIFAPNIEKIEAEGGLDDLISQLIKEAESLKVSVVFSLNRHKLGKLCFKKVPISCIGILNYQGSDENYKRMLEQAGELREKYKQRLQEEMEKLKNPVWPSITSTTSSTPTSFLSCEAAEFVPSSQLQSNYYSYYQHGRYIPTFYSGYDQEYYCYDQGSLPFQPQVDQPEQPPATEDRIWTNMLEILKTDN